MICTNKNIFNEHLVPCGQCMPCRINKRREWAGRIYSESTMVEDNSVFATLTYQDSQLPLTVEYVQNLHKPDIKVLLNRLRKDKTMRGFRYFLVGEYGDETARPHYHMAIFNRNIFQVQTALQKAWYRIGPNQEKQPLGFIKVDLITKERANYIAGYCQKKMTRNEDERLDGRIPEFAMMSKRPPLGESLFKSLLHSLTTKQGRSLIEREKRLPNVYRISGKIYPISSYWTDRLYEAFNMEKPKVIQSDLMIELCLYRGNQDDYEKKAQKAQRQYRKKTGV